MYTTLKMFRKCFHIVTATFECQMIAVRLTGCIAAAQV